MKKGIVAPVRVNVSIQFVSAPGSFENRFNPLRLPLKNHTGTSAGRGGERHFIKSPSAPFNLLGNKSL